MTYDVCYIGNMYEVAEELIFNKNYNLKMIFVESNKLSDDMLTLSFLHDIQLVEIQAPIEILEYCHEFEFAIMCSYGRKIPVEIIKNLTIYNIHYGLLPDYKGRHPNFYSFINNEKYLGITLHEVDEGIDTGKAISSYKFENRWKITEKEIFYKQTSTIVILLEDLVKFLNNKKYLQYSSTGKYYAPVTEEMTTLNLIKDSIRDLINKTKAQARYGGATVMIRDIYYIVKKCSLTCDNYKNAIKINDSLYKLNNIFYVLKDSKTLKMVCEEKKQ